MARWWWRLFAVSALVLTLGCQGFWGLPHTTASNTLSAASSKPLTISGRVEWPVAASSAGAGLYHILSTFGDIQTASTVSFIDTTTDTTVGTTWTAANGDFSLSLNFTPASGSVYIVEAVKGLFDNTVNHNAARVRTFVEYVGNSTFTNMWDTSQVFISPATTALCVIWGIGQTGGPSTGSQQSFMGTIVNDNDCANEPPTGGYADPSPCGGAGQPACTNVSFTAWATVHELVCHAVQDNVDPIANVGVDNANNYTLFLSPIPLIYQLVPNEAAVGAQMTISGQHFLDPVASTSVDFGYDTTNATCSAGCTSTHPLSVSSDGTSLVVQVPAGAVTGPVVVSTVDGTSNSANFEVIPPISAQATLN